MVVVVINRKGKIAAEIFDQLVPHLGAAAASAWMLSAYEDLDGLSPIQAIQAGRQDDVRGCATALLQQPPAKTRQ
jgi:hypothetical protein